MPNMKSIINAHNRKITTTSNATMNNKSCNCNEKNNCPLKGNCLAVIRCMEEQLHQRFQDTRRKFTREFVNPFSNLDIYNSHKTSFNLRRYEKKSEIANEVWRIKDQGDNPNVSWRIIKHHPGYNPISKRCGLCLSEKLHILEYKGDNLLNNRNEIISKCRHQNKFLLAHTNDIL